MDAKHIVKVFKKREKISILFSFALMFILSLQDQ